jgi:hypothetical protein
MVQKLRNSTGVFFRSALVLVGWVFFALAQVTPEPLLKLVFASIARVLPNAFAWITFLSASRASGRCDSASY